MTCMTIWQRSCFASLIAAGMLWASPVAAEPVTQARVECDIWGTTGGFRAPCNSGNPLTGTDPVSVEALTSRNPVPGRMYAEAFARASHGDIGVRAVARMIPDPNSGQYRAYSRATAISQDTLLIDGLISGTPVDLALGGHVDFIMDMLWPGQSTAYFSQYDALLTWTVIVSNVNGTLGGFSGENRLQHNPDGSVSSVGRIVGSDQFVALAGESIDIRLVLDATTYVDTGDLGDIDSPLTRLSIDAGNSLHVYLESLTPGARLASASGHDYTPLLAAEVPNPPTAMLFATGLLLTFASRRLVVRKRTGSRGLPRASYA